jgi:hypothetical protein
MNEKKVVGFYLDYIGNDSEPYYLYEISGENVAFMNLENLRYDYQEETEGGIIDEFVEYLKDKGFEGCYLSQVTEAEIEIGKVIVDFYIGI